MKKQLWILTLGLYAFTPAQADTVFNDTFEPDGSTAATRHDDAGAGYGLDIQWRPRVASQAGAFSVVNDAVLGGNAMQFRQSGNSLWMLGQFDNAAADGVTSGASSTPVSLGLNLNDSLELSLKVRVSAAISVAGRSFQVGLLNIPGGPLASDPGTDSSWINLSKGYFCRVNEVAPAKVSTFKQLGDSATTPYQGVAIANLTTGIDGVTAAFGLDTTAHTVSMRLTRTAAGVQIDSYWDGNLVSTAADDGTVGSVSPFANFNTVGILRGTGGIDYLLDDVRLEMTLVPEPNTAALGFLGLATLLGLRRWRR